MSPFPPLLLAIGLASAVLTWLLVALLIRIAPRIGLVDRPNERSSHSRVTPRGGGIGFVVAITLGITLYSAMGSNGWAGERIAALASGATGGAVAGGATSLLFVLAAALFIAAISLRDDFKSLGAGLRFACHFAAAGVVLAVLGPFPVLKLALCNAWPLGAAVGTVLSLLWVVGLTNVYNFMDGIDGIAGIQGVVGGLAWMMAGLACHAPITALLGALLFGGCTGFLAHNWAPAKIFMGDVGSAFLGFLFAVVSLVAVSEAPDAALRWPVFGALAVWPFIGDGLLTFVRRLLRREKVWEAHRSHLYQRLVRTGWSHSAVSALYGLWALISLGGARLWLSGAPGGEALAIVVPLVTLAVVFAFVTWRERRGR